MPVRYKHCLPDFGFDSGPKPLSSNLKNAFNAKITFNSNVLVVNYSVAQIRCHCYNTKKTSELKLWAPKNAKKA